MEKTLVSLLLDMTGSMQANKQATIDAYNEYVGALQINPDTMDFLMSVSVFNSLVGRERVAGPGPVADAPLLSAERYKPDGSTPLYDAIADTIKEAESNAGPVLVVVLTDGQENASQHHTKGDVNTLVADKIQAGWQFVYLACGLDAMVEGAAVGVPSGSTLSYSPSTTRQAMHHLAGASASYGRAGSAPTADFFGGGNSVDLRNPSPASAPQPKPKPRSMKDKPDPTSGAR